MHNEDGTGQSGLVFLSMTPEAQSICYVLLNRELVFMHRAE